MEIVYIYIIGKEKSPLLYHVVCITIRAGIYLHLVRAYAVSFLWEGRR